jgi:hypothetical protein
MHAAIHAAQGLSLPQWSALQAHMANYRTTLTEQDARSLDAVTAALIQQPEP